MPGDGYLLGLDAGGTVLKARVFDLEGRVIAGGEERCPSVSPRAHWFERDMDALWAACASTIRACLADVPGGAERILAVGLGAHGDGLYLLDADHRPVRPAILAVDSRAASITARWSEEGRMERALELSGLQPHDAAPPPLAAWVKAHEPESYARIASVLCCKDWLRLKLTGRLATDPSDASALFTTVRDQAYSAEVLALYGVEELAGRLPPIVPSADVAGEVGVVAARETGLPLGTPVVCGAHDTHVAALGAGAAEPGELSIVAGTWAVNQVVADAPHVDRRWETHAHLGAGRWMHMATSPGSASSLDWAVARTGLAGAAGFARAMAEVETVADDESRILFHPFLFGSGRRDGAAASLIGLRGWYERGHIIRAVLEGVVLRHRGHVADLASRLELSSQARLTGGAARSSLWCQMFADGLDRRVEVPDVEEAGARGAAVLAGVGVGIWPDVERGAAATARVGGTFEPTDRGRARLVALAELSDAASAALRPLWNALD